MCEKVCEPAHAAAAWLCPWGSGSLLVLCDYTEECRWLVDQQVAACCAEKVELRCSRREIALSLAESRVEPRVAGLGRRLEPKAVP